MMINDEKYAKKWKSCFQKFFSYGNVYVSAYISIAYQEIRCQIRIQLER